MSISNRHVIGYFHICQKDGWERSFDLIFFYLKHSGLYDRSHEIRCGVVNDDGYIIPNERFNDPKLKIIVYQTSEKYERPTLLHMKEYSNTDPSNTAYYYLHTKGLRHYGTETEQNVIDWIKLLLYWNVTKWKIALNMLYHFYYIPIVQGQYNSLQYDFVMLVYDLYLPTKNYQNNDL